MKTRVVTLVTYVLLMQAVCAAESALGQVFIADPMPGQSDKEVTGEFMELRADPIPALRNLHTGMDIKAPSGTEVYPPIGGHNWCWVQNFDYAEGWIVLRSQQREGNLYAYFCAGHVVIPQGMHIGKRVERDTLIGTLQPSPHAHLHAEIWVSTISAPDPGQVYAHSPRPWAFRNAEWMPDSENPVIEAVFCHYDGSTYTWYVYAHDPAPGSDDGKNGICSIDIYANNVKIADFDFSHRAIGDASADEFYKCLSDSCAFIYKLEWEPFGDVPREWRIIVCDCSHNCEHDEGEFPTVQEGVQLTAMVDADELQFHWVAPDAQYWFMEFEVLESIDDSQVFTPINESPIPVVSGQYEYSYSHRLPRDWERLEYRIHGIDEQGEGVLVARHELQNEMPAVNKISVSPVPASGPVQISLQLAGSDHARVHVYDASGRLVRSICDERLSAGKTDLQWDGKDPSGRKVPSGIYFAKALLKSANHEELRRVIILR